MAICQKELGPEHERTAIAQTNLGRALSRLDRYAEADSLLRTAYETNVKVLGEDDWGTALSLRDLARNLRYSGRLEEALPAYVKAHEVLLASLGEVQTVAVGYVETGEVLWELGRRQEAWEWIEKGLAIYAQNDDPGAGNHQQVRLTAGQFAFEAGDLDLAEHHVTAATDLFENFRERVAKGLSRATTVESPWATMAALRLERPPGRRVVAGLCLQIDPNDPCYQELGEFDNLRIDTIHFNEIFNTRQNQTNYQNTQH